MNEPTQERVQFTSEMIHGLRFTGGYYPDYQEGPLVLRHQFKGRLIEDSEPCLLYYTETKQWILGDSGGEDSCSFESKRNEQLFLRWLARRLKA